MISLRKYLEAATARENEAAAEFCQALADLSFSLLAGVESHVQDPDHPRLEGYPAALRDLRERIEANPSPEALREAGAAAVALLGEHRRNRDELQERQGAEVQKIVAMLNQTIAVLSGGSERSITRLRQIEDDLKSASAIGDIVALKDRLRDTLRYVREQSAREREESRRTLAEVERDAQRAQERLAVARSGVPGRAQAEQAFGEILSRASGGLLVLIVLERADAVRERFGSAFGERFVYLFVQDLVEHLPAEKRLFRWNDRCLLVELPGALPLEPARAQLRTALAHIPAERRIDVGSRLAVFSNQHRWTAIPVSDFHKPGEVGARLDQLVRA